MKTKGQIEEFFQDVGFENVSMYHPGLLDQGDKVQYKERVGGRRLRSTKTKVVADLMSSHLLKDGDIGSVAVYDRF